MDEEIKRLLLFVKQVRLALKPDADPTIVKSCLEDCGFAEEDLGALQIRSARLTKLFHELGG